MPLIIRRATAADQATITRMIRSANLNRMNLKWPNFLVAEEGGAVVGIGQVKPHGDASREVASMGLRTIARADYPPYFTRLIRVVNGFARLAKTEVMRRPG